MRSLPLRRGTWWSRYVQSVATSPAQSCTSVHRCHSTSERRALSSSTLRRGTWTSRCVHSVAPGSAQSCTAAHSRLASLHLEASRLAQLVRCVAALGRPAACIASRLVQFKAAQRPTAVSRHSTSERHALRSSPLRRGTWLSRCVHSVAPGSAQSCTAAHRRLASLNLRAWRLAPRRCVAGPLSRCVHGVAPGPA